MKNIFITGKPGCGKTTLIKEITKEIKFPFFGFLTEEIREKGKRKGFKILDFQGKEGILAQKGRGKYQLGKYKVNVELFEKIGVSAILKGLKAKAPLIVIDEIGKMELFSQKFKKTLLLALNSPSKVLATLKLNPDFFTQKIRKRKDVKIFYLKRENWQKIKKEILFELKNL